MNKDPSGEIESTNEPLDLPEDAVVITQVSWAWLWSATPWLIVVGILSTLSLEPFFASIIVLIIIVPRFLTWRRTAYIVTDDTIIYQRGGFTGSRQYSIPLARLVDVKTRDGMFGRGLGYQAVDIMLDNQASASLTYVPAPAGLEEVIRERMKPFEGQKPPEPESASPDTNGATRPDPDMHQDGNSSEESS